MEKKELIHQKQAHEVANLHARTEQAVELLHISLQSLELSHWRQEIRKIVNELK